jgi:UDP-GlcNAc:undecaprenyl-phosphate GlcNAc-1-phosphate transferase
LAALAAAAPAPRTRVFAATLFYPTLTFLYPIFDTALVSILRRSAGRPISVGGRDHSSHRLVSLGLGERKAVLLLWTLSAAGAGLGLLTYALPLDVLALAILMIAGVTVFGVFLGTLPAYAPPDTAPVRLTWIRSYIPSLRAGITLVIDVLLAGVALLTAFLIRWDNTFVDAHAQQFRLSFPIIIGSQMLASIALRTFDSGWRWFGARDLFALVRCALLGPATSMFALWFAGVRDYSRGVILLYAFFVLAFTAGLRLSMRLLWQTLGKPPASRRAAVLGATGATEIAVLVLQRSRSMKIAPVGVVDPDPACDRMRMHGIAVHYAGEDLVRLLRHIRADVLVVPAGEALSDGHRRILEQCRAAGVSIEQLDVAMSTWTEDSDEASVDAHAIA